MQCGYYSFFPSSIGCFSGRRESKSTYACVCRRGGHATCFYCCKQTLHPLGYWPWLSAGPRGELVGRGMQSNFLCVPFVIALIVSCSHQLAAEGLLPLHGWRVSLCTDGGSSNKRNPVWTGNRKVFVQGWPEQQLSGGRWWMRSVALCSHARLLRDPGWLSCAARRCCPAARRALAEPSAPSMWDLRPGRDGGWQAACRGLDGLFWLATSSFCAMAWTPQL